MHEDAPPVDVRAPFRVADEEPIEVAELVLTEGVVIRLGVVNVASAP